MSSCVTSAFRRPAGTTCACASATAIARGSAPCGSTVPNARPRFITEEVRMPLPDGPRLWPEVTVAGDGAQRPVLLNRRPYCRDFARALHVPVVLARQGWAVVLQDVRGRCWSDGTFDAGRQ